MYRVLYLTGCQQNLWRELDFKTRYIASLQNVLLRACRVKKRRDAMYRVLYLTGCKQNLWRGLDFKTRYIASLQGCVAVCM